VTGLRPLSSTRGLFDRLELLPKGRDELFADQSNPLCRGRDIRHIKSIGTGAARGERPDWFVLIRRHAQWTFIAQVDEISVSHDLWPRWRRGALSYSNEGPFGGQQGREQNSAGRRSK
jgi:hypothetical protein